MSLTINQRLARLRVRYREIGYWCDRAVIDLTDWRFNGEPIAGGERWPSRDGVVCLEHAMVTVPAEWPPADARLELDLGGEGLVRLRYDDGTEEDFGHDPQHRRYPLRGRSFAIEASAVARKPFGRPNPDARLGQTRLALADPAVDRLVRQLRMVHEAARVLQPAGVAEQLLEAAERALNQLDWPSATADYISRIAESRQQRDIWAPPAIVQNPPGLSEEERASVTAASGRLDDDLRALRERYPREGAVVLVGHAHLDLAWLWPLEETRRKAQRTYHTIIGLMERYPEFRFNQSSAQIYAFIEQDDPELFAAIRNRVANGQWEPIGGMWVEPDINMPSGESLVRQLLYGQRYFQRTFGRTHTVCWLPDCFGFSPALPQLLRGAGIEDFFTIKLTWSETNTFPYDLFWWEGLDGSRVLAHMFDNPSHEETDTGGYNADPGPWTVAKTWENFRGKNRFGETLLSIGYGDGGGGVTPEMLEEVRSLEPFPALPVIEFTSVREFYERAREAVAGRELPVWLGEMYLELHRGTLTTQGRTKYLHRRAERDLVAAEVIGGMHHLLGGPEPPSLEAQWRLVLRNEFHDILPGSSIREVYQTAEDELASVVQQAASRIEDGLSMLAERLVPPGDGTALLTVNPDLSSRPLRLELAETVPGAQQVEDGSVLSADTTVPGLGVVVVPAGDPAEPVTAGPDRLENRFLRVTLAEDGTLAAVYDKRAGREVLAGRGNQLWAYVDKPYSWDAWDIDAGYAEAGEELPPPDSMEVVEVGPHRAAVRIVRHFRHSTVRQDVRLWANSPRIEFDTTLDWHDRRWLLKARFPLAVRSSSATFETAFGVVERSTHRNTSWDAARFEVAGHRFADLSEPGYGVALLNDGKYGHHALGNELGLTLLRSPAYPDPLADEGRQRFRYALLPHAGGWLEGGVLMEAEDLNRPLPARPVAASEEQVSWQAIRLEGLPLGLGALKAGEEGGGLVLRVYEPQGGRGTATLALPDGWALESETDLLEQPAGRPDLTFTPFQVRSWRLLPSSARR